MSYEVLSLPGALQQAPITRLVRFPPSYRQPDFQELDHRKTIAFFHPGYAADGLHDPLTELLCLPAYDKGGFHHGTALSALSIIANNKPGYLTRDSPGGARVEEDWDDILPSTSNYYYHLSLPLYQS